MSGYGGWSNAAGTSGVLRAAVDGEPELDRVELDGFDWIDGELGEPSVVDGAISVPFTDAEGDNGTVPLRDFEVGSLGSGLSGLPGLRRGPQETAVCRFSSIEARNSWVV